MGQDDINKGHKTSLGFKSGHRDDFVLEKGIFSNIFEKDIRRVFICKRAERIAKAVTLVSPAFKDNAPLLARAQSAALALLDASTRPAREAMSGLRRELLALSHLLSLASTGGLLSPMNADIIAHEIQTLLNEVTAYDEPVVALDAIPSIALLAKISNKPAQAVRERKSEDKGHSIKDISADSDKGQIKDTEKVKSGNLDRKSVILELIKTRGKVSIKEVSTVVRGVSEKTIQRELTALTEAGVLKREGERRWSTYALA